MQCCDQEKYRNIAIVRRAKKNGGNQICMWRALQEDGMGSKQPELVPDNQDDDADNDSDDDACCVMTCTGKAATAEGRGAGIEIAGAAESSKQLVFKLWTMEGGCTELQCFPLKSEKSFEFQVKDDVRPINH